MAFGTENGTNIIGFGLADAGARAVAGNVDGAAGRAETGVATVTAPTDAGAPSDGVNTGGGLGALLASAVGYVASLGSPARAAAPAPVPAPVPADEATDVGGDITQATAGSVRERSGTVDGSGRTQAAAVDAVTGAQATAEDEGAAVVALAGADTTDGQPLVAAAPAAPADVAGERTDNVPAPAPADARTGGTTAAPAATTTLAAIGNLAHGLAGRAYGVAPQAFDTIGNVMTIAVNFGVTMFVHPSDALAQLVHGVTGGVTAGVETVRHIPCPTRGNAAVTASPAPAAGAPGEGVAPAEAHNAGQPVTETTVAALVVTAEPGAGVGDIGQGGGAAASATPMPTQAAHNGTYVIALHHLRDGDGAHMVVGDHHGEGSGTY